MEDKYELIEDIFVIPDSSNRNILYAPLQGMITVVNDAFANKLYDFRERMRENRETDSNFYSQLNEMGLLGKRQLRSFEQNIDDKVKNAMKPTHAIFLLSDYCNFRCKYCYASPAAEKHRVFDRQMAMDIVKFVLDNTIEKNEKECVLSFHGGGEPMLQFDLIKKCVEFAKAYIHEKRCDDIEIKPMIVTNGYLSMEQIDWLAENMASIQVSFDGPEIIQNDQRPLTDGGGTHDRVLKTINRLIERKANHLLIKSTISQKHVEEMDQIAKYMCESIDIYRFHFGAVLDFGRAPLTGYCEPDADLFIKGALQAQQIAAQYGKKIVVSLAQETFPNTRDEFCGLTSPNFSITLDGKVTACYEVMKVTDSRSDMYFYGKYNKLTRCFEFNTERIKKLVCLTTENIDRCKNCFAKWQCAGDCQSRWFDSETGELIKGEDFRCRVNRALVLHKIKDVLLKAGTA